MMLGLTNLAGAAILFLLPEDHHEHRIKIEQVIPVQAPALPQGEVGETEIHVSGRLGGKYEKVDTAELRFWVRVWQPGIPNNPISHGPAKIWIDGERAGWRDIDQTPRVFEFSIPYRDLPPENPWGALRSPVELCNEKLAQLAGGELRRFRERGGRIRLLSVFEATAYQDWKVKRRRHGSDYNTETKQFRDTTPLSATIICQPLGATTPVAEPSSIVENLGLRAAAMGKEKVGRFSCPDKVRLYATITARHRTKLKALLRGPKFLSPPRELQFQGAGVRSFTETYDVKWDAGLDQLASSNADRTVLRQSISFTLHAANSQGLPLKSEETSIDLECEETAPPSVRLRTRI